MIILEKPYVSNYLKETAAKFKFPVLANTYSEQLNLDAKTIFFTDQEAVRFYTANKNARIYTNSENAIPWIASHLPESDLPKKINWFKDKVAFRQLTQKLFPEVFYQALLLKDIDSISIADFPKSFVIKPAIGFFSLAVYHVHTHSEWPKIKEKLKNEIEKAGRLFPAEVLNSTALIIEGYISGVEFAFDAYYDENGQATILNILKHEFASSDDVSDRVYSTSKEVMQTYLPPFTDFLNAMGNLIDLRNFPLHVEVRIDENGKLVPIEVNPLRFGGFCTTADLTPYAWGFNPYAAFFQNHKPDWNQILKDKAGKLFGLIVLDNSTGFAADEIKAFDYEKLLSRFEKPLELRKLDYHEYPLFGFVFTETREENTTELQTILQSDLKEFILD
ncbi:MAG: ATP-grasp domain-containing protein [Bacteroidales bacterium]|nr:ATP-grasp domain-containing protein [Bacteroidales bacterium]